MTVSGNAALVALTAGILAQVGLDLMIGGSATSAANDALLNVELGALSSIGGSMTVQRNAQLTCAEIAQFCDATTVAGRTILSNAEANCTAQCGS
jgi:hypothetical protein